MAAARHAPTSLRGRLWSLYNEARIECDDPNSAPDIRKKVLRTYRGKLDGIAGAADHLLAVGIQEDVRQMLKHDPNHHDGDPAQYSFILLWPGRLQSIVQDIGREHVFVPSRGEFVELIPTEISRTETIEAGVYLVGKGRECITVGNKLKRLGRIWIDPRAQEYIAYCTHWIENATEADGLDDRWEGDADIREKLRVSVKDRIKLRELLDAKIAELHK